MDELILLFDLDGTLVNTDNIYKSMERNIKFIILIVIKFFLIILLKEKAIILF